MAQSSIQPKKQDSKKSSGVEFGVDGEIGSWTKFGTRV